MNHKRRRPKNARAGCLLCKPHKANGAKNTRTPQERRAEVNEAEGLVYYQPVALVGWMHPTLAGTTVAVSGMGPFTPRRK